MFDVVPDSGDVSITRTELTDAVGSQDLLPDKPALMQNYPNPFNPATRIGMRLGGAGAAEVMLAAYDLLGREVAVLANGKMAPGNYEVGFDGPELSGGVYPYRMRAGSYVETRKLLLVR